MSDSNDNAFPRIEYVQITSDYGGRMRQGEVESSGGLTKRELFAAMAMQGICANDYPMWTSDLDEMWLTNAKHAVKQADALLAELAKERP